MINETPNEAAPRHVITIGGKRYALLRQFTAGAVSVVWQAQPIPKDVVLPAGCIQERYDDDRALLAALQKPDKRQWPLDLDMGSEPVVIKLPNSPNTIQDLQAEAQNLRRLRNSGERARRIVELLEDRSNDPDCPCLILAWASGQQLDTLTGPLPEREGLFVAYQTAQVVEAVFNKQYVPLTDSVKANSLFWDENARRLTVIDLGIVGENMAALETQTLPILGNTFHQILTGAPAGDGALDEHDAPAPNRLGEADGWRQLSFETRRIIPRFFAGGFLPCSTSEVSDNDLFVCLSEAIGAARSALDKQISRWDESSPLEKARQEQGASAINWFDIARQKDAPLTDEDRRRYQTLWREMIHSRLQDGPQPAFRLHLRWFCQYDPEDKIARRAWQINEAALSAPALDWSTLWDVWETLNQADDQRSDGSFALAARSYEDAIKRLAGLPAPPRPIEEMQTDARTLCDETRRESLAQALEQAGQAGDRQERRNALETALKSWRALPRQSDEFQKEYKQIEELLSAQIKSAYALNQYDALAAWLRMLRQYAPDSNLLPDLSKWCEDGKSYSKIMPAYQQAAKERDESQQKMTDALAKADYKQYKFFAEQWQRQTADLISQGHSVLEKGEGFRFTPDGHSLRLMQSLLLGDTGQYNQASRQAEESLDVLHDLLEQKQQNAIWLSEKEVDLLGQQADLAKAQRLRWQKAFLTQSPDVLRVYVPSEKEAQEAPEKYAMRWSVLKLLGKTNNDASKLRRLAQDKLESENADMEQALAWLNLALLVDPKDGETRRQFRDLRDDWMAEQEKELDARVVGKLKSIVIQERLEQRLLTINEWLLNARQVKAPPAFWLSLADMLRRADALRPKLKRDKTVSNSPGTEQGKEADGEEDVQTAALPSQSLPEKMEDGYKQQLNDLAKRVGEQITGQIKYLHGAAEADEPPPSGYEWLDERLREWEDSLNLLEKKLPREGSVKAEVNWPELREQIVESQKAVKRALLIEKLVKNVRQGHYEAARNNLAAYQTACNPDGNGDSNDDKQ